MLPGNAKLQKGVVREVSYLIKSKFGGLKKFASIVVRLCRGWLIRGVDLGHAEDKGFDEEFCGN